MAFPPAVGPCIRSLSLVTTSLGLTGNNQRAARGKQSCPPAAGGGVDRGSALLESHKTSSPLVAPLPPNTTPYLCLHLPPGILGPDEVKLIGTASSPKHKKVLPGVSSTRHKQSSSQSLELDSCFCLCLYGDILHSPPGRPISM